jgi:hypothetical protein
MSEKWVKPELTPQEQREVEQKREDRRTMQPYATELADRELEHAQQEKRPTQTNDGKPSEPPAGNR